MYIEQISVFIENKPGSVVAVTETLANAGINIRALSLSDTTNFGVLHLILDEPDRAVKVLREAQIIFAKTPVLAVELDDKPGALNNVLNAIAKSGCNVEYAYAFVTRKTGAAVIIMRIDDECPNILDTLLAAGIKIWDATDAKEQLDVPN